MNKRIVVLLLAGLVSAHAWPAGDATASVTRQEDRGGQRKPAPIVDQPYSATHTMTIRRHKPDGEATTHEVVTKMYRDSDGRTRRDMFDSDGEPTHSIVTGLDDMVLVLDHRNRLVSTGGVARHAPVYRDRKARLAAPAGVADRTAARPVVEQLGEREIEGVTATGEIRKHRIGKDGDSSEVTTETWMSRELGIALYVRNSRPNEESIVAVSGLDRREPDPALFAAPDDYRPRALTLGRD